VLSEYVFSTGRGEAVVRLGPAGSLTLTDHIELNLALTFAVSSPDRLGAILGAYGVAGIRYKWATGEREPKLPWSARSFPRAPTSDRAPRSSSRAHASLPVELNRSANSE